MLVPRTIFHLHEVCDPEDSRYALGGVFFERSEDGSPVAVATDGRRMVAATWDEDAPEEYPSLPGCNPMPNGGKFRAVIPKDACRKLPKLAQGAIRSPKAILARNVAVDEHTFDPEKDDPAQAIPVGATDLDVADMTLVRPQLGRYPRYHDVFSTNGEINAAVSVRLDLGFLEDVCRTMRKVLNNKVGDEDYRGVTLTIRDHESAVYLTARKPGCQVAGVLMPLRPDDNRPPEPGWMPRKADAKAELEPENQDPKAEPIFSIETALHVVADSWEKLRPVDVERLLDGQDADRRSTMAGAIIEHRPDLKDRVLGVMSAYAHPSNQDADEGRRKRLLKELDELYNESLNRGGSVYEGISKEIRMVYDVYGKVPADDSKSLDNCEVCIQRFRERMGLDQDGEDQDEPEKLMTLVSEAKLNDDFYLTVWSDGTFGVSEVGSDGEEVRRSYRYPDEISARIRVMRGTVEWEE